MVIDPKYDDGPNADVGVVYFYRGVTGELNSVLKGNAAQDRIGSNSILGGLAGKGENLTFWEDPVNRQVIVGLSDESNIVLAHLAYPLVTTVLGDGTVTRSPAQDAYREGMTVTLTASGNHSAFTGWSGDLTGNQNPAVITMEAARAITAIFQALEFRNYVPLVKKP